MGSPHDHFRSVLATTGDNCAAFLAIRETFGLTMRQAKEVMLQAMGTATSLAEHEERIAAELEQELIKRRSSLAEISYDLVMSDDMAFVEGTYRLPDGDWQVVIVSKRDVSKAEVVQQVWESGVSGVYIRFPHFERLDQPAVERMLTEALDVSEWVRVNGPDSMNLR